MPDGGGQGVPAHLRQDGLPASGLGGELQVSGSGLLIEKPRNAGFQLCSRGMAGNRCALEVPCFWVRFGLPPRPQLLPHHTHPQVSAECKPFFPPWNAPGGGSGVHAAFIRCAASPAGPSCFILLCLQCPGTLHSFQLA